MTTNRTLIVGASLGLLVAIPGVALALQVSADGPDAAPHTRAALVTRLQQHFAAADANHDGAITQAEADAARTAMRSEHRQAMFTRLDADHDGKLSLAEFSAPRPDRGPEAQGGGEHGRGHGGPGGGRWGHRGGPDGDHGRGGPGEGGMFARADADHDGRVTFAEFSARPLAMFDRADANHDGTVTRDEMRAAWRGMRDHNGPPPAGE